jgi:broad specificity phosphatase PhoE
LLVSHEMIGRMLLRNLLDLAPDEALAYGQPHEVVYRIDVGAKSLEEIRT